MFNGCNKSVASVKVPPHSTVDTARFIKLALNHNVLCAKQSVSPYMDRIIVFIIKHEAEFENKVVEQLMLLNSDAAFDFCYNKVFLEKNKI